MDWSIFGWSGVEEELAGLARSFSLLLQQFLGFYLPLEDEAEEEVVMIDFNSNLPQLPVSSPAPHP